MLFFAALNIASPQLTARLRKCLSSGSMARSWKNRGASIPLRDTGLLHAAGIFTTMRSANGRVFRLDAHLQRLRASSEALFIPLQYSDAELTAAVDELLKQNNLSDARLRLTVTRGSAKQDPVHGLRLEPSAFLTANRVGAFIPTNSMRAV